MATTPEHDERIANMVFGSVYPFLVAKIEKKGRTVDELHQVMLQVVDIVLEGFMLRAVRLLKLNFVMRKLVDATAATCRGAGHMVVNKVLKNLDNDQLDRMAEYFDKLIFTADS